MQAPYFQQPAYAPYGAPYVPPRYPLVSLVGQTPPPPPPPAGAVADPEADKKNPFKMAFWDERTLGVQRKILGAGAVALTTIAALWSMGVFEGGKRAGARRDVGSLFGFANDPARRRKRRRTTTKRRDPQRASGGGFGGSSFGGGKRSNSGRFTSGGGSRDFPFMLDPQRRRSGGSRRRKGSGGRRDVGFDFV